MNPLYRSPPCTFFNRRLFRSIGLVLLSVLIWIAGPLIRIDTIRPLESETTRLIVIAVLLALWLVVAVFRNWRRSSKNARFLDHLHALATGKTDEKEEDSPEVAELRNRFNEGIALLKKATFSGGVKRSLLDRLLHPEQHLYQRPWYIFIGAPGSGKTTALINSGLNFPLADQFGKAAISGVGGTRNCDWWFTDEAVLLDTAGRYTTQDSNKTVDEDEWKGFVRLLQEFRKHQPVNGAILTISVSDLLSNSEAGQVQHAEALRTRLQELRKDFSIDFPVYVLVTKTDLLAGFEAYFETFRRTERSQVWGFTFPLEHTRQEGFDLSSAYHAQYQLLTERLHDGLPDVLDAQSDGSRRALAYLLPQQFAYLESVLGQFLMNVFGTSTFEETILPRGVYFTSGTQEGAVFDQVMGDLKRYMGVQEATLTLPPVQTGKSYFLHNVLHEIVFKETGLAGRNLKWERHNRNLHLGGYATMGLAGLALMGGLLSSYFNNEKYLSEINDKIPAIEKEAREFQWSDDSNLLDAIPFLTRLVNLTDSAHFDTRNPPLSYRYGLFQGNKMRSSADSVYRRSLERSMLPLASHRIENITRNAPSTDLEHSYEALKVYLMLYSADHYRPDVIESWLLRDIERTLPAPVTAEQYQKLREHLRKLFHDRIVCSPYPKDELLISEMRQRLSGYTPAQRAYSRLQRMLLRAAPENVSITSMAGTQSIAVFKRDSGRTLTEGIQGLFTFKGYWDVFNQRVEREVSWLAAEDEWVLDLNRNDESSHFLTEAARTQLVNDVKQLYFMDYLLHWDEYLRDIRLADTESVQRDIEVTRILSAPDSPLKKLAQGIVHETWLLRDATAKAPEQPSEAASESDSSARPESLVDDFFQDFRRITQSDDSQNPPPIDAVLHAINGYHTYISATDTTTRDDSAPATTGIITRLSAEAARMPTPIREMVLSIAATADTQINKNLRQAILDDAATTVGKSCRDIITGRYPFSRDATADVSLADFASLFAPGGKFDAFFKTRMEDAVDTSEDTWRFKSHVEGKTGETHETLKAFHDARVIRNVFFTDNKRTPSWSVDIKALEIEPPDYSFTLAVGDLRIVRQANDVPTPATVRWPGSGDKVILQLAPPRDTSDSSDSSLSLEDVLFGNNTPLSLEGPWALNHLFDHAHLRQGKTSKSLVASFDIAGSTLVLEVTSRSTHHPFRLPQFENFRCPGDE